MIFWLPGVRCLPSDVAAQTKAERCNSPKKICGAKADLPYNHVTAAKERGCSYAFQTAAACCLATTP